MAVANAMAPPRPTAKAEDNADGATAAADDSIAGPVLAATMLSTMMQERPQEERGGAVDRAVFVGCWSSLPRCLNSSQLPALSSSFVC